MCIRDSIGTPAATTRKSTSTAYPRLILSYLISDDLLTIIVSVTRTFTASASATAQSRILNRVSNMNSKKKFKNSIKISKIIKISFRLAKNKRKKSDHPVVKIQKKLPPLNERILNLASNINSKKKNTTIKISLNLAKNKGKISNYLAILIQKTQKIISLNKDIHLPSLSYTCLLYTSPSPRD